MKIVSVSVIAIRLPFLVPFKIAYTSYHDMPSIIVKIETDKRLIGFGEGVANQHVTGETWESTYSIIHRYLAPAIIGENPFNIERIHQQMNSAIYGMPTAKAAIDIACFDIMGKASGQPVFNLIGGKYYPSLTFTRVIGIQSPEKMAEEAKQLISQGTTCLKIIVGTDLVTDIERIRAVSTVIGRNIQMRIDVNQGWKNRSTAISVLKQIDDLNIDWIEQPINADDLLGLADVRKNTSIPIMVDEGLRYKELREVIIYEAADYANIKLMKCGGIYPALKLIHQAELAGIQCVIGSMIESSIATAAGAHLASAQKNVVGNELSGPLLMDTDVASLHYEDNKLYLHDEPGLGIQVNEEVLDRLKIYSDFVN
ncbi:mandelate racemase/muconate lactonizing enzyme family protein [Ureibacillus sp. NPDC094379]